ncbi:MAG TPA: hypothetical protein VGC55_10665 [Dokdonella sp.]
MSKAHPSQAGGSKSKIAQIHKHLRTEKNATSKARHYAQARVPLANHGVAHSTRGTGTVLYDQTGSLTSNGLVAETFSASSSFASLAADSADDFVVSAGGWTITGFNFLAFNYYGTTVDNVADVYVYADDGGLPGASPVCTSIGSSNSPSPYDAYTTLAGITLNSPCALDAGTYWVSLAFQNPPGGTNWPYYWLESSPVTGAEGAFRNPSDAFGTSCTDWEHISACGVAANDFAFQILGTAGGGGDTLQLSLTLALDNGDPAQCGVSTNLSVDLGDQINFCYTVTNNTGVDLSYQTLSDTLAGTLFTLSPQDLPAGGSLQFNRIVPATVANNGTVTATWTSQDGTPGYGYDDTGASNFVDITGSGTALNLGDDSSTDITMPFSFPFYGVVTNQLTIGNNGGVIVGTPGATLTWNNTALPGALDGTNTTPALLPLWDDFFTFSAGHDVYYATLGTAPNRQFVIEYADQLHYDGGPDNTDGTTFEIIIDEATGNFSFEYSDVEYTANGSAGSPPDPTVCDGGICATVGVQQDGTVANQYSFDTASLHDGQSIAWTPSVISNTFTATASATLDVGFPVIAVDPTTLAAAVPVGGTTTATLTINNTGNRDLNWNIDEAPSTGSTRAHFPAHADRSHMATAEKLRQARAGATKLAPVLTGKDGKPLFHPFHTGPSGVAQVPSFANDVINTQFVSLDAAVPDTLTNIGALSSSPVLYIGGSFANNDFSTEYAIGYSSADGSSSLATIDTSTGAVTVINGALSSDEGAVMIGLRWDGTTNTMYASGVSADGSTSYLYTIDSSTGALTLVGPVPGVLIESLGFDSAGNLYGLDIGGDQIIAMDKASGDFQPLLPLGFDANYVQAMDFDPSTDMLWYAGYNKYGGIMYEIDVSVPSITEVGPIGGGGELPTFAVAVPSGGCATPDDVTWLSVAPASGTTAGGASSTTTVTFDATGLTDGVYDANLCVHSNDAANRLVAVPVALTVGTVVTDEIFKDGFDGTGGGVFTQPVVDPSFEATTADAGPNPDWDSLDTNPGAGGSVFYSATDFGIPVHSGDFAAWFGGWGGSGAEVQDFSQSVTLPSGGPLFLNYWREVEAAPDVPSNLVVSIDGTAVETTDLSTQLDADFVQQSIDISSYADGGAHVIAFTFTYDGSGAADGNSFVDDVTIDQTATP